MDCRSKHLNGKACGKITAAGSCYCPNHRSQARRDYKRYKRAHATADIITRGYNSSRTDPQVLLKHYALVEKARSLRQSYTEFLAVEHRNAGHAHQLHLLERQVRKCEERLAKSFSLREITDTNINSTSAESSEDTDEISKDPDGCVSSSLLDSKDPAKESEDYMNKLIQENKELEATNCESLKISAKLVHQMFKVSSSFDVWFESPQAFRYFGIVCLLTCKFSEILGICSFLGIPPVPIIPLDLVLETVSPTATLRSEVARKMLPDHVNQFASQIKLHQKQLFQTINELLPRFQNISPTVTSCNLFLVWDTSTKLYRTLKI